MNGNTTMNEPVIRKSTAVTKRSSNAGSSATLSDAMEKGKEIPFNNSTAFDRRARPPRRFRKTSAMSRLQRRLVLHFKRQSRTTRSLYTFIAAIGFLVGLIVTLVISVVIHQKVLEHNPEPTLQVLKTKAKGLHKALTTPNRIGNAYKYIANRRTGGKLRNSFRRKNAEILSRSSIFISTFDSDVPRNHVRMPPIMGDSAKLQSKARDFGGLHIEVFLEDDARRNVYYDPADYVTNFRRPELPVDDDVDAYYAFDDDVVRANYLHYEEAHQEDEKCRRVAAHKKNHPACNSVHEYGWLENQAKYLAAGSYREVLSMKVPYLNEIEMTIVKQLSYRHEVDFRNFEFVRMDAIVAEIFTSHPLIFDIYGFCGLVLLTEFFPHGDMEAIAAPEFDEDEFKSSDSNGRIQSPNGLTPEEKLDAATQMAESLAVLHGYEGGVIVHDDVQLAQHLYNEDMSVLKLNDFNRAEFMLWDDEKKEYCKYKNGHGHGTWRATEEYLDAPLNEKIDTFSYGNNLYTILTGNWPFYKKNYEPADKEVISWIKHGTFATVDPRWKQRGPIERTLAEIVERCYVEDVEKRISIFEICKILWKLKADLQNKDNPIGLDYDPQASEAL